MPRAAVSARCDRLKTAPIRPGRKGSAPSTTAPAGVTPWGTYVLAVESIHSNFGGELSVGYRRSGRRSS
jgi:secreted PhoX family phosphatase